MTARFIYSLLGGTGFAMLFTGILAVLTNQIGGPFNIARRRPRPSSDSGSTSEQPSPGTSTIPG